MNFEKKLSKWDKLRSLLLKKSHALQNTQEHIFSAARPDEIDGIFSYDFGGVEVRVEAPRKNIALKEVTQNWNDGIDSTGLLVWPAEVLLAKVVKNEVTEFKAALELGAGYSGIAAILLAKICGGDKRKVVVTDGNELCIEGLSRNGDLNGVSNLEAQQFNWKDHREFAEKHGKFDLIFGADILFFRDYHLSLIESIYDLLTDNGQAIIVAPNRDNTLDLFKSSLEQNSNLVINIQPLAELNDEFRIIMQEARQNEGYDAGKHEIMVIRITSS